MRKVAKLALTSGNLELGAKNSTCFLSSRYLGIVRAAPNLSRQSWVCICKLVGLFGLSLIITYENVC